MLADPIVARTIVASLEDAMRDPHFVARGLFSQQQGAPVPDLPLPIDRRFPRCPRREIRQAHLSSGAAMMLQGATPSRNHGAPQRPDAVDHVSPSPRSDCTGRKSDSRLRFSKSAVTRRMVGQARRCDRTCR